MNRIARVHAADRWTGAQEPRTYAAPSSRVRDGGDDALLSRRKHHRQRYCSFTFLYARPIRLSRCGLDFWRTKEEHRPFASRHGTTLCTLVHSRVRRGLTSWRSLWMRPSPLAAVT